MDRIKAVNKVTNILEEYNLNKVLTYLSSLSADQAYNWVLDLLRINKSYDISPTDWETLIEIYNDKIDIIETEIHRYRQEKNSRRNRIKATPDSNIHSLDLSINNNLISLGIEDIWLHPILRNFRNEDSYQEDMTLRKDNPSTRNQYIAHLKGVKSYYQQRLKEMVSFHEFSEFTPSLTSQLLNVLYTFNSPSSGSNKPRGYQKGTPNKKQTFKEIEECLEHRKYFHDSQMKDPNIRAIASTVLSRLEKKFENGELPGVEKMIKLDSMIERVKNRLSEIGYKKST